MTTPMDDAQAVSGKALHTAGFAFAAPFDLQLLEGDLLVAESVLRMMPRRRVVVSGLWQGKPVVAKLFFSPKDARRHADKEIIGNKLLQDNKIPTPTLLHTTQSIDKRIYVLIFERIFKAEDLDQIWLMRESIESVFPLLQAVCIELATQHVLGVLQHDMHLKNFLITEKTIYTLDGAQIEVQPNLLTKKVSMNNLALFLAQLGVGVKACQETLFRHYAKARGWLIKQDDIEELFLCIKKWNELRWRRFERKIFRDSTSWARIKHWQYHGMYQRQIATPGFLALLKDPEIAFSHPYHKLLKAGRSSTVVKVEIDGLQLVVKRYNLKNIWHQLRRCVRITRAQKSWRLAQKLNLFGIATAKPLAFIENRVLGFKGKSYFIMEYVAGKQAGDYLAEQAQDTTQLSTIIKRITMLLKSIAKIEITHGDLKLTNILVNSRQQPVLIDLDGATEHVSLSGLRHAWHKEIKRFLRNFQHHPRLKEQFEVELNK